MSGPMHALNPIVAPILKMVHTQPMRTSITLGDDIYELASSYAHARDITFGAAIGELVRRGESAPRTASHTDRIVTAPNGLPVFKSRGRAITSEMVRAAQEDEIE